MIVWIVAREEDNDARVVAVCSTKELAERRRDVLYRPFWGWPNPYEITEHEVEEE